MCIGESCAILRYLGLTYMPPAYPLDQPALCARIDFAMDAFSNVYKFHRETVYVTSEAGAHRPIKKAVADYLAQVTEVARHLVGDGPFVGGSGSPTIADYKAVPFFFAAMQPACQKTIGLAMPPKVTAYVDAFCAAVVIWLHVVGRRLSAQGVCGDEDVAGDVKSRPTYRTTVCRGGACCNRTCNTPGVCAYNVAGMTGTCS